MSSCRDTALEILALRQQGGGFLPCLTTKILRIYSSRFNWYINNKVLIKRIVGLPGDVVDITEDGAVSLNGEILDEPYVSELAKGECDIGLPYQVPENRYFVMGDHRAVSIDSRSVTIGCIAEENIVGVVFFRVLPFVQIGFM